jgi:hypothetical protein
MVVVVHVGKGVRIERHRARRVHAELARMERHAARRELMLRLLRLLLRLLLRVMLGLLLLKLRLLRLLALLRCHPG